MISGIVIKNFKCLKSVDLKLKRITVFIGPNGSGKTSIFQALLTLKNFVIKYGNIQHSQIFNLDFVNLGDPTQVSYLKGSYPVSIGMCINDIAEYSISIHQNRLNSQLSIFLDKNHSWTLNRTIPLPYTSKSSTLHDLTINSKVYKMQWDGLLRLKLQSKQPPPPSQALGKLLNSIQKLEKCVKNIYYIPYYKHGFIRSLWPLQSIKIEQCFIVPEEYVVNLFINPDFEDYFMEVSKEIFNRTIRQFSKPNAIELIVRLKKGKTIGISNEGGGLNRVTYILGVIIGVPKDSCILLEEPETNLHPKAQYNLPTYLVELSKEYDKQILITTHSEHILYGFLDCIRKKILKLDDFVIYYLNKEELETKVKSLEIDEKGRVKGGLPGFFEENIHELIAALEG